MAHMRRFLFLIGIIALSGIMPSAVGASTSPVDLNSVTVSASKDTVTADGYDQARIRVRVKTTSYLAAAGASVRISGSRGSMDEFVPQDTATDDYGLAEFTLKSLKNGSTTVYVDVDGHRIGRTVNIQFVNGLDIGLQPGDLIKIPTDNDPDTFSDTAVYYYASNGRRYVFTNDKSYFTWYTTFDNIKVISLDDMTKIPIGGNITYRPGIKPVKFQTDNKVYAVYKNGELRWMRTADVARAIYGPRWTSLVDDINESFYVNYTIGLPIDNALDFLAETIANKYSTIAKDRDL